MSAISTPARDRHGEGHLLWLGTDEDGRWVVTREGDDDPLAVRHDRIAAIIEALRVAERETTADRTVHEPGGPALLYLATGSGESTTVGRLIAYLVRALPEEAISNVRRFDPEEVTELAETLAALVPRRVDAEVWDELLGPFYTNKAVQTLLGGVSRTTVNNRRDAHELLGFKSTDGVWLYPTFQFTLRNGRRGPPESLASLLEVLVPAAGGLAAARWLRTPNRRLDGRTPWECLVSHGADDGLVDAARRQAAVWDDSTRL